MELSFKDFLVFDCAMGTMLQSYGMKAGELSESFNFTKPQIVAEIHRACLEAGSDVIAANTFGANRYKFANTGLQVKEVVCRAVEIARDTAKDKLVALSVGPLGQLMEPYGKLSFEDAYEAFKEQIAAGASAGADLILIQTMTDIYEARAAILAARENTDLPVICTMTFQEDGRTLTGTDPLTMVNILQKLGLAALGINCSLGPKEVLPLVSQILEYSKLPVIVQPNAGLPRVVGNKTVFDVDPDEFGSYMKKMAQLGVRILGGCCGTTPKHIEAIREAIRGLTPVKTKPRQITAASSANATVVLGDKVKIIGERINPTVRDEFKAALLSGNLELILREAVDQKDHGADLLDVNVGLPEIDEKETMVKTVKELQSVVSLPLVIDSVDPKVIEAAVRVCNGRPIINSVNGEKKSMEAIFPIAKKYGCLVIALTLDEKGIPHTVEERFHIAEKIIKTAAEYGISKEDIIVDTLVLTASAQQKDVQETIKALRLVKEKLGVLTTLGITNVSFGLPFRELLNRTYLATALGAGLDLPIINPLEAEIMDTVRAFNVLWNYDQDSQDYVKSYSGLESKPSPPIEKNKKDLKKIIIDGIKEEVVTAVRELLKEKPGLKIVDDYLIPALNQVGEKYEKGEVFLPQLILSAETVRKAFEIIKENGLESGVPTLEKGRIVLATVKGDVHDIGKNIVKILLENYGFTVFDLGIDVDPQKIVTKVKQEKVSLVGLSALMTTTVKNMEETIKVLRTACPECKVMVGGAVLNKDYAKMIGADYYGKDAKEAVKIAEQVFS